MNFLIVYAHPEEQSLNGALKDKAIEALTKQGHQVKVSNLYEMKFKAVASKEDFLDLVNANYLNYIVEQAHASDTNTYSEDILFEQQKVKWADVIIFQFPIWWTDAPAILKGWFDRIFAYKFAYGPHGRYENGLLKGKKAMLSITMGSGPKEFGTHARKGRLYDRLYSIHHEKLFYCGLDVLEPFIVWGSQMQTKSEREDVLHDYENYVSMINQIPTLTFYQNLVNQ